MCRDGSQNPIVNIHDQGAEGNCNVVKEIIYPKGAEIDIGSIAIGEGADVHCQGSSMLLIVLVDVKSGRDGKCRGSHLASRL